MRSIWALIHLSLRSRSLKRHFSVSIGRRSRGGGGGGGGGGELSEETAAAEDSKPPQKPNWRCFSFEEIQQASNGFHQDNLVGRGGYVEVYKGVLGDGQSIAVKRLTSAAADEQTEEEFLTELGTVGHVRHPNVSALLGCCIDRDLHRAFSLSF